MSGVYVCIYMCVCVCVCVCYSGIWGKSVNFSTHSIGGGGGGGAEVGYHTTQWGGGGGGGGGGGVESYHAFIQYFTFVHTHMYT